ncbi:MAG: hypothetical protein ACQEWV_25785 [Bacillota bacterium]
MKQGAKVAGTIAIIKNPLTWIIAGILLFSTLKLHTIYQHVSFLS